MSRNKQRTCVSLLLLVFGSSFTQKLKADEGKGNALKPNAISYLALGDSYTIGESVEEQQRWPRRLAIALRQEGVEVADPKIVAKTGWTTDELESAISTAQLSNQYGLVTLLIGVNNQYRGRSLEDYEKGFERLLEIAIRYAGDLPNHVVVVSIPDYGITPFIETKPERKPREIAKELDAFNAASQEITKRYECHWVNITDVSRKHGTKPEMLAHDELHPSGKMYELWVHEILPVAQKALQRK